MLNNILEFFYIVCGIMMLYTAYSALINKTNEARYGTAIFWGVNGVIFVAGNFMPFVVSGILLLVVGVVSVLKKVKIGKLDEPAEDFRRKAADKIGNKIFIPAVVLAFAAFAIAQWSGLGGLIGIGIASVIALIVAVVITKSPIKYTTIDSDRLLQQVGPSAILPQILAALGIVFTLAGVGDVISNLIATVIPKGNILAGCIAYCIGMFVFTIVMGNAFAAFAVITAGIGFPFVIANGADPAIAGALALTAGYCGTLITPMAANFNVVPAALLEMENKNQVIFAQFPIAILLLVIHIILMYFWAF